MPASASPGSPRRLLASIEATVVRGRCLPYGEGITYWPVVEVLKQLDVLPADEAAAVAIRSLLGETEAATSAEEIAWAFRKTLEQAAAERPLVVVFDDIQWGEETFLDLIEHVALLSSGASILLLCMARPELDRAPPHLAGDASARAPGRRRRRRAHPGADRRRAARRRSLAPRAATRSSSRRCWRWPARRTARWSSRPRCRRCSRRAWISSRRPSGACSSGARSRARSSTAVPSRRSHPTETQVTPRLAALVRKELIRPDRPQLAGEDGFRFRHLLIRDAAYDALPKATRADLHERFAAWLERARDRARRAGRDPRLPPRAGLPLPRRARAARRRRAGRGGAAAPDGRRPPRAPPPGLRRRREPARARRRARPGGRARPRPRNRARRRPVLDRQGRRRAPARRCPRRACRCGGRSCRRAVREDPGGHHPHLPRAGGRDGEAGRARRAGVARVRGRRRRPGSVHRLLRARGGGGARAGRWTQALEAYERAFAHARRAGHLPPGSLAARAACRFFGTTPVSELLAWLDENEPRAGRDHFLRAYRAGALAMLGRFDEARAILAEIACGAGGARRRSPAREHHRLRVRLRSSSWPAIPPPPPSSEQKGAGCTRSWGNRASCRPRPGAWRRRSTRSTGSTRPTPGPAARRSSARATTRERRCSGGRSGPRCSRAAASTPRRSGSPARRSRSARRPTCSTRRATRTPTSPRCSCSPASADEAAAALEQALERYERKGNLVSAQRMRARLAELSDPASG